MIEPITREGIHARSRTNGVDPCGFQVGGQNRDIAALLERSGLPDFPLARKWMCAMLCSYGISDDVLGIMASIPRHAFAPANRWRVAYVDQDLWTGLTWMTAPHTVARVVDSLPRGCAQVLEVGTGTGYQTVLLSGMHRDVVTADLSFACVKAAGEKLALLGSRNVRTLCADIRTLPVALTFDAIVVNAALWHSAAELFPMLKPNGGILIVPTIVANGTQRLLRYSLTNAGVRTADLGACRFEPMTSTPLDRR